MGRKKIYDIRPRPKEKAKDLTKKNKSFSEKNKALGLVKNKFGLVKSRKAGISPLAKLFNRIGKEKGTKSSSLNLRARNLLKINKYWLLLPAALLIVLIIIFQFSARVDIEVWPFERSLSFQNQVLVDVKVDKSRFSNNVIMGKEVSQEHELTKKFSATGSAIEETKAEGKVKVINDYHLAQVLVEKTRFLSADGKLFYLKEGISIPPATSLEADVEAAEPGPGYNIKPTTFSIPGLLGSPRYTFVYAESFSPMKGGEEKTVAQITKADLDRAEKETSQGLFLLLEEKLKEQAGSAFSLLSGTIESQILEKTFSQKAGDKKADFDCFLEMEAQGIAFQKQDFDELIEYLISKEIDENEEVKNATLLVVPEIRDFDLSAGKAYFDVKVSAAILKSIDVDGLKRALSGKSIKESEMFLVSDSAIDRVELKIFPFWLLNIPQNLERIDINFGSD